jgi:hypothetical protein
VVPISLRLFSLVLAISQSTRRLLFLVRYPMPHPRMSYAAIGVGTFSREITGSPPPLDSSHTSKDATSSQPQVALLLRTILMIIPWSQSTEIVLPGVVEDKLSIELTFSFSLELTLSSNESFASTPTLSPLTYPHHLEHLMTEGSGRTLRSHFMSRVRILPSTGYPTNTPYWPSPACPSTLISLEFISHHKTHSPAS